MNRINISGARIYSHPGPFLPGQTLQLQDDGAIVQLIVSTKQGTGVLVNLATGQNRRLPVKVQNTSLITKAEIDQMTGMTAFVLIDQLVLTIPPPPDPITKVAGVEVSKANNGYYKVGSYAFSAQELRDLQIALQNLR